MLEIKMLFSELPISAGQKQFSIGIKTGTSANSGMSSCGSSAGMRPGGGMGSHGGVGMGGPQRWPKWWYVGRKCNEYRWKSPGWRFKFGCTTPKNLGSGAIVVYLYFEYW